MSPAAIPGSSALRAGIGLLAAFGFALSYDALRQMAAAIHIRGPLTYTFPLVIDGFIAIGIAALLILRTAPWHARLYVWALVGLATATSIWANALHAIRLNQQARQETSLRLDDITVGALSAIAPLALAGAVHLYLLVRRHPHKHDATSRHNITVEPRTAPDAAPLRHMPEPPAADVAPRPVDTEPQPGDVAPHHATTDQHPVSPERLALARTAPLGRNGRASRRNIEATFRAKGLTISRKEADQLKDIVQAELDQADQDDPQREKADTTAVSA